MVPHSHPTDLESHSADNAFHPTTTNHVSNANQFSQRFYSPISSTQSGGQFEHNNAGHQGASSSPADTKFPGCVQMALSMFAAPRVRRSLLICLVLVFFTWIGWQMLFSPRRPDQKSSLHSLDLTSKPGILMANPSSLSDNLIRIRTLDPRLVPTDHPESDAADPTRKRLIIVGDVHGCKDELMQLLEKVSFNQQHGDHLIFVGDLINKGPDSPGVVDLARQHSASSVRGNHEDRILQIRNEMVKTGTLTPPAGEESYFSSRELGERALARSLSDEQVQWLENCPVMLNVGPVPNMGQLVVVHAGLVPGVGLDEQDLASVMTMRTIDVKTHVPSPKKKGMNWAKMFDKHQTVLYSSLEASTEDSRLETMTVVYGHDASSSLSVRTFTKGLDSGCVKGGKLTALVIDDGGRQNIVQVSCREYLKD